MSNLDIPIPDYLDEFKYTVTSSSIAGIFIKGSMPVSYTHLPGSKDVLLYDRYKEFADKLIAEAAVICCLDLNAIHRIDAMGDAVLASPARKILIDHHA